MKKIIFLVFLVSCSSTKYKAPSVVYRSPISPKIDPSLKVFSINDYLSIKNLSTKLKKNAKLIVFYQNYDLFEYSSTPHMAKSIEYGINTFIESLKKSKLFSSVHKFSLSHIQINGISDMIELSRRTKADAFILVSSSYNYYKYSNTLGYFLGWMPIINYFTPIHATYGQIFIQLEFFNKFGKGIFADANITEKKENIGVAFSKDHFQRLGKELNYSAYKKSAQIVIDKYKQELKI